MNTLEQALSYVDNHWAIMPIQPKNKLPQFDLLPKNNGKATWKPLAEKPASPKIIKSWFDKNPDINIGIITGNTSKLVILDLDAPYTTPFLTNTVQSNRGSHLYFSTNSPVQQIKKQVEQLSPIPNADWKYVNGYVLAPNSTHPSGKQYEWMFGTSPSELKPLPFHIDHIHNFYKVNKIPLETKKPNKITCPNNTYNMCCWDTDKHWAERENTPLWLSLSCNADLSIDVFRWMGIQVNAIGQAFCCPLHPETKPSACLYQFPDGSVTMYDFHSRVPEEKFWGIGEIYYHHKTGLALKLSNAQAVLWKLRCFADFGAVSLPEVEYRVINTRCTDYTRQVYDGFIKLIKVGKLYDSSQNMAPFSWRFAQDWCGVSERKVKMALTWLLDNKFIKKSKLTGYKYMMYSLCQMTV